jgi:hypothetical protein
MNNGLLWFDGSDSRDLTQKIKAGAAFYQDQMGFAPVMVFVNPAMLAEVTPNIEGIEVRATNSVLQNHFWYGD